MIVGVHLRNQRELTVEDRDRLGRAVVGGALVMPYHDPEQVVRWGLLPEQCIVRLPDTVWKHWPSQAEYIPSYRDYASGCLDVIERFYEWGFRRFIVDNEPDLSWKAHNPIPEWGPARTWAWLVGKALFDWDTGVRYSCPEDVELGMTPFSCPVPDEWYDAAWAYAQEETGKALPELFDFIGAHCYWQAHDDMNSDVFGANYRKVWELSRALKPIIVTECGNSSSATDAKDRRLVEYPAYPSQVADDPVCGNWMEGVYFFILGHNGDWGLFDLDDELCSALGARGPLWAPRQNGGGGGPNAPKAV